MAFVPAIICAALFGALFGIGCGHTSISPGDSLAQTTPDASVTDSSTDSGADSGTDRDANVAPTMARLASNGVPIPAFPARPDDGCQALGIELAACPASGTCAQVSCDCGDAIVQPYAACIGSVCLASVSCPAVCALNGDMLTQVFTCEVSRPCQTNDECGQAKCVIPVPETNGHCQADYVRAACYGDSECAAPLSCVLSADGKGSCQDGSLGASCNLDSQCVKSRCLLADGAFAGQCTNGADAAPCLTDHDCELPLSCVASDSASPHVCSTENKGEPCTTNAACRGYFCVDGQCATGSVGEKCETTTQCQAKLICVETTCSAGAPGDRCHLDTDCQHACAAPPGVSSECTDGNLGSKCRTDGVAQCAVGLHCVPDGYPAGTCTKAGTVGAQCSADTDCQSQKCGALGSTPFRQCTDGQRGQSCNATAQCQPGLHCVTDGLVGVCVAGISGDPCRDASECASGSCLPPPTLTFCPPNAPQLSACGEQGVCVGLSCFQTCASVDGGAPDAAPE